MKHYMYTNMAPGIRVTSREIDLLPRAEEVGHFPRDMLVQSKLILQGLYGVTNYSLNPTYKDDKYGIFFGISLKPNKFSLQNQC